MSGDDENSGLGVSAARGVLWTGLGQVLRQVIQVIGSVALARLLVPDDFGVLGMAMFFVGIGQLFADFGIGSAIIQARSDDRVVLSSCFWLNLAVAATLALLVLVAAPWIADFYQRSDLAPMVAVLSLNLLLAGLQVVPQALLYRDMRFADLAKAQVLGSLAGALVAIMMAWYGAGVWSLVAQPLASPCVWPPCAGDLIWNSPVLVPKLSLVSVSPFWVVILPAMPTAMSIACLSVAFWAPDHLVSIRWRSS